MIDLIICTFKNHQNIEYAPLMEAYMKNNFEFFGIKSPQRKLISKPFLNQSKQLSKTELFDLVKQLWRQPQRELHYLAQEITYHNLKLTKQNNRLEKSDMAFFEWLATQNSWWDSIDFIAPKLMGDYFIVFPTEREKYIDKWLKSKNVWLIRCALLFQLKYKDKTDLELLYKTILNCIGTQTFFINKAIGWVLRENSKRIPLEIKSFIEFHEGLLSNLSKKEGLKHFV